MFRRFKKILLISALSILGLALTLFAAGTLTLRGSLPRLDGQIELPGLQEQVTIIRDSLGVPDITAESRLDAARALGYLHAQERFFQMDLQRRNAAGEMAELIGDGLLASDRDTRRHRFRTRAEQVVQAANPKNIALLNAYTDGVNSGLDDLNSRPFEYLLLQKKPDPWQPEDTILTLYAMFLDLSLFTATTEENWAVVRDNLSPELAAFFLPRGNRWEAPLQTEPVSGVMLPDSTILDLRQWKYSEKDEDEVASVQYNPQHDSAGSNNWAVAGKLTAHGGALLANDMHLGHGLPNIWYRARMSWPEAEGTRSVVGVTLPGAPALVAGSNGNVAWGFTNSYGDWADLVILEFDPENDRLYKTPEGWQELVTHQEIIKTSGAEPDTIQIDETIWGPIWGTDTLGRRFALRWTAHDVEAANLNLVLLESASTLEEALAVAGSVGIPQQNLVCADDKGRIAWTIAGPIPNRVGWDGRLPVSWADGTCRWDGYRHPADQPRILNPKEGRIWTANNRVTSGYDLAVIGDGGYGLGARARQIRDDLRELDKATEKDMLNVQLDDRAIMLGEWRNLVLEVLKNNPPEEGTPRAKFQSYVRDKWSGRAEPSSVSYRLMRSFGFTIIDRVHGLLLTPITKKNPDYRTDWLPHGRAITWEVLAQRPDHLLPPWNESWDELILQAVDRAMEHPLSNTDDLSEYTWGQRNQVKVTHPFTYFIPALSRWLQAPLVGLPGDSFMPRVQHKGSGASERMVVSPGREAEGIFHMPGGQSGHPLSSYFLAGHEDWQQGKASPLLPGEEKHRLELKPVKK